MGILPSFLHSDPEININNTKDYLWQEQIINILSQYYTHKVFCI